MDYWCQRQAAVVSVDKHMPGIAIAIGIEIAIRNSIYMHSPTLLKNTTLTLEQ
jgi:hypothetical protein